ncbi:MULTISPECIES: Hsp20/alpha crystallin family protein [Nocardiopsidaceae]|uniref:Hsp20/alpha crystallin family protein n=2 Tax=Nocardiopsidaceae TaxID=83676 RepID=A0ABY6YVJ3_9ACTN|nr:Hsp20/alpha crystallin family protein [Streptomonospora nanhaiensis]WAE76414.1 Hsp20/alpha crystallin family protein [Streptomonospora nanhaiensis]
MLLTRTIPFDPTRAATAHQRTVPMDILRTEDELLVRLDLPGADADSIDLEVERDVLTVNARRPARQEGAAPVLTERPTGPFTRRLRLGRDLDTDNIGADYTDGVLTLRLPVAEKAKPRKILLDQGGATL